MPKPAPTCTLSPPTPTANVCVAVAPFESVATTVILAEPSVVPYPMASDDPLTVAVAIEGSLLVAV